MILFARTVGFQIENVGSAIDAELDVAVHPPLELVAVTDIVYEPPLLNKKFGVVPFKPVLPPLEGEILHW